MPSGEDRTPLKSIDGAPDFGSAPGMIREFFSAARRRNRATATASSREAALTAHRAWIAWGSLVAAACSPSAATVAQGTAGATACSQQDLVVFNYDRKARNWLAACKDRVFVCSPAGNGARCAAQGPDAIDRGLAERVEALGQVPTPQRDLFVHYDISSQDWDGFARLVASVARLRPGQVQEVEDPTRLYTNFSPEFDAALVQCLGVDGVARVDVSASGGLSVLPNKPCLMSLRSSPDLSVLRGRAGQSFVVAAGVRGIEPIARPGAEEPAEVPVVSPLEVAVRGWLDEAATDILACTRTEKTALTVQVDTDGATSVSLPEELVGSAAEGCVRSALSERRFEGGPLEVLHLVRPRAEAPAEETPEDAAGTSVSPAENTGTSPGATTR